MLYGDEMENITMKCSAGHDIKRGLPVMFDSDTECERVIEWDRRGDFIGIATRDCKKDDVTDILICGIFDVDEEDGYYRKIVNEATNDWN